MEETTLTKEKARLAGSDGEKTARAFTVKAIVAGLIGILLIAGGSKFSPTLAKQALLEHQLGIGIYFYFFLICLLWNPLCSKFIPRLAFNIRELAVAMVMTLAAGGFAWYGWMRQLYTQSIMMPEALATNSSWQTYQLGDYVEKNLLPNGGATKGEAAEKILGGFINGIKPEKTWIPLQDIPFDAWTGPLLHWGVIIIVVALMCVGLLMFVHRQWVRNEKLSYPLATVAESLFVKQSEKNCFADLFLKKLFWFGFCFVVLIHGYNYAVAAFPTSGFLPIHLSYPLGGLSSTFPIIAKTNCYGIFASANVVFLIVGIAYFLAPALSLSIGLNGLIYLLFAAQVYETTGAAPTAAENQIFRAGAYLAFVVMLFILGRRYYGSIMWKAISWKKVEEEDRAAVTGARLFLLTALLLVFLLCRVKGMDVIMAVSMTLMIIMVYLVFTRIICEAGIPIMANPFMPITFFSKMFGGAALGPHNLMSTGAASGIFFADMKQLLMPYLATGMKITDDAGVKLRKVGAVVTISILVAFAVAFGAHMWQYYSLGISDGTSKTAWSSGIGEAVSEVNRLGRNDQLSDYSIPSDASKWTQFKARTADAFSRLKLVEPEKSNFYVFFLLGVAAVFITGFLRTRFLWWPFHAVIFCIWGTAPANTLWFSFLLGWLIRSLVVRLGGEKNYIVMKPLFLGLIFGQICASGLILLFGLIYYLVTKTPTTIIYQV